ncbi:energy-coupling factor transporter transmembrane component T family protein [Desulfosediminicola ganghwensis]|uniref:energy-coupling factor transporter transmembrane component T family protein n=1 Tax=Desulfosediminicola ganghwensis TaxID=2569540 RepID=UPI0010ABEFB6|nr:energy-coupling factor transporter transmembrane component T [Desulfosediminicola ganghwensis]
MQPKSTTTTLFIDNNSWVQRLHPFTKLCYVLFAGVGVYAGPSGFAYDALLLLVNVAVAGSAGVLKGAWRTFVRIFLPLLLFMIPIHSVLYPGNQTILLHFYGLNIYQEGLMYAFNTLLQLAAVLTASLLFVFTTHPADLITAISHSGKSPTLAYLLGSPLLMMSAMQERVATIQAAQRARGLNTGGNFIRRIYSLAPLVVPLVVGAIVEIEQRAIALEVRGFKATTPRTSIRILDDSSFQRMTRWLMVATAAVLVFLRLLR